MAYRTSAPNSDPEFWLDRHVENNPGTGVVWQSNPLWFIDRYKSQLNGYVLYDSATINQATSVAGATGALMVHESQLSSPIGPALTQAGLSQTADVRGRSADWVYDNYSFNRDLIYRQQPNKAYQLRSHAVLNGGFVFDETGATRDRFLAGQNDHSLVLGWGYENSEGEFFSSASQNNLMTVPADFLQSAASASRWEVDLPPRPAKASRDLVTNPNAHYVAFVMSDGDNAQWLTNDFATSDRWFGSPHRGDFPMTFDLTPALLDINPTALKHFYDQAAGDASEVSFVTAGGLGINYPSQLTDVQGFVDATVAGMQRVDHNVISVLDTAYDTRVLNALADRPEIDGVMFKTNSGGYADNGGALYFRGDTPVMSVRYTLWDGFSTPNDLVATLNSAPRDPLTRGESYSIVNVHPWSTGTAGGGLGDPMSNVDYIASNLGPGVEVVTLDELFVHLSNNRLTIRGQGVGANLVPNPDFEIADDQVAGRPESWLYAAGPGETAWVSPADSDGQGSYAAAIDSPNADWRSPEFDILPGEEYLLSLDFQFQGVAAGEGFRADARFFSGPQGDGGVFLGEAAPFVDASGYAENEWHTITATAVAPAGAAIGDVRLSTYFGPFSGGRVLIDNVSLRPLVGIAGDYNGDGVIDAADYTVWRDSEGQRVTPGANADGNRDGVINQADLDVWRNAYGLFEASSPAVPEPAAAALFGLASLAASLRGGRASRGEYTLYQ
ncbi:MAG: GxGYxYP family putative glycoside hydrolase [Botrimarina sp.]